MKSGLLVFAAALLAACAPLSHEASDGQSAPLYGWLVGSCLALPRQELRTPHDFTLVDLAHDRQRIHGIVVRKAVPKDHCEALLPDRRDVNEASGNTFYVVSLNAPSKMGIGILGTVGAGSLSFDYCLTGEGVHFTVMRGSHTVWEDYYYLGYDIEATCASAVDE